MGRLVALPVRGEVFVDARGEGRSLRVSWHHEDGVVVLSLWRYHVCTGTLRLAAEDVPYVISTLTGGLARGYGTPAAPGGHLSSAGE